MEGRLKLTCYSDILCVWAYVSQARLEEVKHHFPGEVEVEHRFCSVFGDTRQKIGEGWSKRGGYEGFGQHVLDVARQFDHIEVHPDIWKEHPPVSSTPAHLAIKAVQQTTPDKAPDFIIHLRRHFFGRCEDISQWAVLESVLSAIDVDIAVIKESLHCGVAHAELEADRREQQANGVSGSPTILLNEGRQKLYGNVGYGVIEANIRELLRSPQAGAASWC